MDSKIARVALSSDGKAIFLLIAMVLWFNHELLWTEKVPFFRDLGPYFYPIRWSLAQSFRAGEFPLWDRHMAAGYPLLADFQSAAFYPPHLFFLILPFFTAVKAGFLFHYTVAALGSYILCRRWAFPPSISLIGAILFTFGGGIVSLSNLLNHFQAAVWLPWVLWSGERCLRQPSSKNFLLLTGALLFQFLAGSPEIYLMSMGLLLLDGLRVVQKREGAGTRRLLWVLLGSNALVIALAMAQVLPTWELLLESRGKGTIGYQDSTYWSLRPLNLLNVFFLDKEVNFDASNGLRLFFSQDLPLNVSLYLGAIALPGFCLWLFRAPFREKAALLGLIALSLAFSMGRYTPVYSFLFEYVPFSNLFRFPEKFLFLTVAFILFTVLRGLDASLGPGRSPSTGSLRCLAAIWFLIFIFYCALRYDTEPLRRFVGQTASLPHLSTPVLAATSALLVNFERQIALMFGVVLLLLLMRIRQSKAALFSVLLVALAFVDLDSAHRPYQHLLEPKFIFRNPKVLPEPDLHRLFHYTGASDLHPSYYRISRRLSFRELQATVFGNLLPNTGVFHGFDYLQEIDALGRWPYLVFLNFMNRLPPEKQYEVLGALNVQYVTSFFPLSGAGIHLIRHFPEYPSWLYRVERAVPRTFVVSKVQAEPNPMMILGRLFTKGLDPLKEVILDRPLFLPRQKHFQARAEIIGYTNREVGIRASLSGSGVLVLADSFYPGWKVYVDGQEREIIRANLFFRAVVLSAGDHLVEFRYQPRSFALGMVISLGTLAGVIASLILIRLLRRV